jgi:DNA primase
MLTRYQRKKLMDSIQIVDVFRHYGIILLVDGGGRFRCHCPFHIDRTPSLKVYEKENSWYAFCCSRGTTVWDFIRHKEDSFREAEVVLKELATIELPEDPMDDLIQELKEKTKEKLKEDVEVIAYLLGVSFRDFLVTKKQTAEYPRYCKEVDDWFKKIDDLLDEEDIEISEMQAFEAEARTYIEVNR